MIVGACSSCLCRALCDEKREDVIGIYMPPETQSQLSEHLQSRGLPGLEARLAILKMRGNKDDRYIFEPLYGERAAIRLRGIVTSGGEAGSPGAVMAATAHISSMAGPLKHEEVEVSIPLLQVGEEDSFNMEAAADLPSRIMKANVVRGKSFWKGRLPAGKPYNDGSNYKASSASFTAIPWDAQIILEGIVCSSRFADKDGNCIFDRSKDLEWAPESSHSKHGAKGSVDTSETNANGENLATDGSTDGIEKKGEKTDSGECPVCAYVKAGPCGEEFIRFDDCVTNLTDDEDIMKCTKAVYEFSECTKKNMYYDVMNLPSRREKEAAATAAAAAAAAANAEGATLSIGGKVAGATAEPVAIAKASQGAVE